MKQCPICDTKYPNEHTTCPTDGAVLLRIREWAPGTIVHGKYCILTKLGEGGMGTVYKAEHLALEEVRALKVMGAHLASDPKFVQRFKQEARAARRLRHPNAVHVDDFEQADDGSLFIAMDYVDGVSLRQLLQVTQGPLPLTRALGIARGVAEGLGAAHALGMVHRDIKPENILLARDAQGRDVPKVLDFGLVAVKESSMTLSKGLLLTPRYASPEQWKGMMASELDARADLYALGMTLYEMLTGRLPFSADSFQGWMRAHLEELPLPPSRCNSVLLESPAVDSLVLKLLAKDREQRTPHAQDFLRELNLIEAQLEWNQPTLRSTDQPRPARRDQEERDRQAAGEGGGKAVFASHLDTVHVHSSLVRSVTPLGPLATVPPLPTSFVNRSEILDPIIKKLLSTSETIALTAIAGMFGVGKTICALALCHDSRVRTRFSDGIVWLNVGKETNVSKEDRVKQVAEALNKRFDAYGEQAYRSLLADKSVLVVLDDVWTREAVEPFLITSGRSRLLYTSRDKGLAGPLGAKNYEVDVLDETEARHFLAAWTGMGQQLFPEPCASEILGECRGLALALAMIGAALKGKPTERWQYVLDDLKKAKLRNIAGRPTGYAHETLDAAIAVSVECLTPDQRVKYLRLAVSLEDMVIRPALLRALWGGNERDVDDLVCLFADRSLVSRDAAGSIRLHDLQLDYVRSEHPDPTTLALLRRALDRSFHIVSSHPEEFASQMVGRLIAHRDQPGVAAFLNNLDSSAPRPRLRPLQPALEAADSVTIRVLAGHAHSIHAVALSRDGKVMVSGSDDGTVRVWDVRSKQAPRIVPAHASPVNAVALSSDGKVMVSGSGGGTVRVWDLQSKQAPPGVLEGHADAAGGFIDLMKWADPPVDAVALSLEGHPDAAGGFIDLMKWADPPVNAVALSSDGKVVVSGSGDGLVRVWDVHSKQEPRVLQHHTSPVNAVALSSDGKVVVSGSDDRTVRVWDLQSNQPPRVLEGHTSPVNAVALSSDGKVVVSGSEDGTLRVWDVQGKQAPRVLEGHADWVNAVALSSDGKVVVSGSDDRTVRVWDLQGKQAPGLLESHADWVRAMALSSDGKVVVSGSDDGTVRVWDVQGKQAPRVLEGHADRVNAVALSSDGKVVVSGSGDRTVRVWDLQSKQARCLLEGHADWVNAVALSSDGKVVVSGSSDGLVRVWDLQSERPPRILEARPGWVNAVALSSDGKVVVSGSGDGTVRVWDLQGKQPPRVLEGHTRRVHPVMLSSDGKVVVCGSSDGLVRIWDLQCDRPPRVLEGHADRVNAVALSSDGKVVVSGSDDRTVRVWDLQCTESLAVFTCDFSVLACAQAEQRIVVGDEGGQVHVLAWEE